MTINWTFPAPRSGLAGLWDKFIGPGATNGELWLQLVIPLVAVVAAPIYASRVVDNWSIVQYLVCIFFAFDIAGGVITNATATAKRWYHREGQEFPQHFAFVLVHLVHLLLVSWAFLALDWNWVLIAGGYLLVAAAVILLVPLYLQRPIALTSYIGALLLALYVLQQPVGLEWFLPLFYLKLLVSHLPKEEPYRPTNGV